MNRNIPPPPLSGRSTDVVVKYNCGAVVRESWMVADKAIQRNLAVPFDESKEKVLQSAASRR